MTTWAFFADAGMTTPLAASSITVTDGSDHTDTVIYFGSTATGKTLQSASDPGADPVQISIDDASAVGIDASAIRLALTLGGLDAATPGAALSLGATLNSGAGGVQAIFVRASEGALANAVYSGLQLQAAGVVEA